VVDDAPLRVCLERSVALPSVELRFRDWPGFGTPIVHFALGHDLGPEVAAAFAPRFRVLSLLARADVSYQTDAADLLALLRAFGFASPVLVGQGLGAIAPLLVAAWWPELVGALVLAEPPREFLPGLEGRGLLECPPDWECLLATVQCPMRILPTWSIEELGDFMRAGAPG
jgi:pimeloyl-ACP methyl ester carboxylesterase